jgi:glycosyltransferase involved in cell wall biosynthesis
VNIAINARCIGPGMTGIGAYASALSAAAVEYGGEHTYYLLTHAHGQATGPADRRNVRHIRVNAATTWWEQLQLPGDLDTWGIDLYHSPLFTCPIVKQGRYAITVHDVIPESCPELCSQEYLQFYRSRIGPALRAADWVVTTSEFSMQEITSRLGVPRDRVRVIHQGISGSFAPRNGPAISETRKLLGLPERYALFVGMIEPRKNVEGIVRAFGRMRTDAPDLFLVLAGRKDSAEYGIESVIAQSGAQDRVRQIGYVDDKDLPALYAGAQFFAFPSLYEGFGRPIVEAMASGVPVVASNTTSLPEVAGDAALLVDPKDDDALAAAFLRLARDTELRKDLATRGVERARQFTHEQFGRRLATFYDEVARTI